MPWRYGFKAVATGKNVSIAQIDDEVREMLKLPPDPHNFAKETKKLSLDGLLIVCDDGTFNLTVMEELLKDTPEFSKDFYFHFFKEAYTFYKEWAY